MGAYFNLRKEENTMKLFKKKEKKIYIIEYCDCWGCRATAIKKATDIADAWRKATWWQLGCEMISVKEV